MADQELKQVESEIEALLKKRAELLEARVRNAKAHGRNLMFRPRFSLAAAQFSLLVPQEMTCCSPCRPAYSTISHERCSQLSQQL